MTQSSARTSWAFRHASGCPLPPFRKPSPTTEPSEFARTTTPQRQSPCTHRSRWSARSPSESCSACPSASICTAWKARVPRQIVRMDTHWSVLYALPRTNQTERTAVQGRISCVDSFTVPASTYVSAAMVEILLRKKSADTGEHRATLSGWMAAQTARQPTCSWPMPRAMRAETSSCTRSTDEGWKASSPSRPLFAQTTKNILPASAAT
mmetsp:Transcript_21103/g.53926  ORF Transcript_21103/g.53926 Transcript_21103/m.53926 type:complete len:209 (-) Transcript_21103:76-702(-)